MFGRCGFAHAELLGMMSKEKQFPQKHLVNEIKGEWRERRRYVEAYPFFSSRVVPGHI